MSASHPNSIDLSTAEDLKKMVRPRTPTNEEEVFARNRTCQPKGGNGRL
jgi:hypothetical protein